jgi:hypothetical protein
LPSVQAWTLGKGVFAECHPCDTRQSISKNPKSILCRVVYQWALGKDYFKIFKKTLPSARSRALGKEVNVNRAPVLLLSHSHTHPPLPRAAASPRHHRAPPPTLRATAAARARARPRLRPHTPPPPPPSAPTPPEAPPSPARARHTVRRRNPRRPRPHRRPAPRSATPCAAATHARRRSLTHAVTAARERRAITVNHRRSGHLRTPRHLRHLPRLRYTFLIYAYGWYIGNYI